MNRVALISTAPLKDYNLIKEALDKIGKPFYIVSSYFSEEILDYSINSSPLDKAIDDPNYCEYDEYFPGFPQITIDAKNENLIRNSDIVIFFYDGKNKEMQKYIDMARKFNEISKKTGFKGRKIKIIGI